MTLRLFALCGIVAAFLATVYVVMLGQALGWTTKPTPADDGWRDWAPGADYV
jgi:hypothetical protein